jgi:hypothetical protein
MGGRGSAGGISDKGIKYGEEYSNLLATENIKFIKYNMAKSAKVPLETMSALKNRVYVLVKDDKLKSILFYDNHGKKTRQIDLDHAHLGERPHVHSGYDTEHKKEREKLTRTEKKYISKVRIAWEEHLKW